MTLTLAGWRAVKGSETRPLARPLTACTGEAGAEQTAWEREAETRLLIHTAVICDKLHPVPCSTSLRQGRRLNSKTLSRFNPYLTNTQQAAGGEKKQNSTHPK